ncbi:MAG: hypothetical protein ACR2O3_05105 [Rhizobiaceae bacterium]
MSQSSPRSANVQNMSDSAFVAMRAMAAKLRAKRSSPNMRIVAMAPVAKAA